MPIRMMYCFLCDKKNKTHKKDNIVYKFVNDDLKRTNKVLCKDNQTMNVVAIDAQTTNNPKKNQRKLL